MWQTREPPVLASRLRVRWEGNCLVTGWAWSPKWVLGQEVWESPQGQEGWGSGMDTFPGPVHGQEKDGKRSNITQKNPNPKTLPKVTPPTKIYRKLQFSNTSNVSLHGYRCPVLAQFLKLPQNSEALYVQVYATFAHLCWWFSHLKLKSYLWSQTE